MKSARDVVFLFDVDNTLLDNDHVVADLERHLEREVGQASAAGYWKIFEQLRSELGYTDYLGALQLYRARELTGAMDDPSLLRISTFLIDYPFADRLYPGALRVLAHFEQLGATVILSDGDVVFQPRKVRRSGLWRAVGGRVLIYIHKELMLGAVQRRYPARHYVMVDDKLRILTAIKRQLGTKVTTVFARQGHWAADTDAIAAFPPADITVERIGDLLDIDSSTLAGSASTSLAPQEET